MADDGRDTRAHQEAARHLTCPTRERSVPICRTVSRPGSLRFFWKRSARPKYSRRTGAEEAAAARTALVKRLQDAAHAYLDAELDAGQAAKETGRCEETIRRAVREGAIPDRRTNPRARHRIRRGDLQKLAAPETRPYDPTADAQSIAKLRRKL